MEKISPLKSLETFRQFKAERNEKKDNKVHSNPFGITFKGTMLNMDVFESDKKAKTNAVADGMSNITKFVASARASAIERYNGFKGAMISFGGRVKQGAAQAMETLKNPETYALFTTPSVASLSKLPVSELEERLKGALGAQVKGAIAAQGV